MKTKFFFILAALSLLLSCQKTNESFKSQMEFSIEVNNVSDESAQLIIRPTLNDKSYYYSVIPVSEYNELGSDEALSAAILKDLENPEVQSRITTGYLEKFIFKLAPDTDYYVYAFEISFEKKAAGTVQKSEFRTASSIEQFKCAIQIEKVSPVSISSSFVPENKKDNYYIGVMLKSEYERLGGGIRAVQSNLEKSIQEEQKKHPYFSRELLVESIVMRDKSSRTFLFLEDNTDYYLWSSTIDKEGKVTLKPALQEFKTPEYIAGNAVVKGDIPRYYDGADAAEYDPDYMYAKPYVIAPIQISTNENVQEYYLSFFAKGSESTDKIPDTEMISKLLKNGSKNTKNGSIFFFKWEPAVICMVAVDKEGKFGPVYRKVVEFDKGKVSPITEIIK